MFPSFASNCACATLGWKLTLTELLGAWTLLSLAQAKAPMLDDEMDALVDAQSAIEDEIERLLGLDIVAVEVTASVTAAGYRMGYEGPSKYPTVVHVARRHAERWFASSRAA